MTTEEAVNFHTAHNSRKQIYNHLIDHNDSNYTLDDCIHHVVGLRENLGQTDDLIAVSVLGLKGISAYKGEDYDRIVKEAIDAVQKEFPSVFIYRLERVPAETPEYPYVRIATVHLNERMGDIVKKEENVLSALEQTALKYSSLTPRYALAKATAADLHGKSDERLIQEAMYPLAEKDANKSKIIIRELK